MYEYRGPLCGGNDVQSALLLAIYKISAASLLFFQRDGSKHVSPIHTVYKLVKADISAQTFFKKARELP